MLQTKMQRTEAALESCFDIAKGCQEHYRIHLELNTDGVGWDERNNLLGIYLADVERHRKRLRGLEPRLQSTLNLASFS